MPITEKSWYPYVIIHKNKDSQILLKGGMISKSSKLRASICLNPRRFTIVECGFQDRLCGNPSVAILKIGESLLGCCRKGLNSKKIHEYLKALFGILFFKIPYFEKVVKIQGTFFKYF